MGVSTDEEPWGIAVDLLPDPGIIVTGIAPDMGDADIHVLTKEAIVLWIFPLYCMIVYIAVYPTDRFNGLQSVHDGAGADIPRMPYFIGLSRIFFDGSVQVAMGV